MNNIIVNRELCTLMGYRINKGRGMCVLPPWVRIPVEAPMGLAYHNVMEHSNPASFLP